MCHLVFDDFRELIQSYNQQCSNAMMSQMPLSCTMTGRKYGSTIGNEQLAAHASACAEVMELSSNLSPDKNKNPSILPRLCTSMAHNRMETRTSSTRSVQFIRRAVSVPTYYCLSHTTSTISMFFLFGILRNIVSQCLMADVLSVGRAAMATEDNIVAPHLLSTMSENSLLPRKKCNITREQPSTTSTPFGCDGHEVQPGAGWHYN